MKKAATFDGVPVKVGREIYDELKDYALINNKNIQQAVNRGLRWWLDTEAAAETEIKLEKMAAGVSQHEEETCILPTTRVYPAKHPS